MPITQQPAPLMRPLLRLQHILALAFGLLVGATALTGCDTVEDRGPDPSVLVSAAQTWFDAQQVAGVGKNTDNPDLYTFFPNMGAGAGR